MAAETPETPKTIHLDCPLSYEDIQPLKTGDIVRLSGTLYTARDAARAGLTTRVLLNLTAGVSADSVTQALSEMRAARIELIGSS